MDQARIDARLGELLRRATIEVYAKNAPETLRAYFPRGRDVYTSFLPGDDVGKRVEIAGALRAGGYNPVLHVPARQMLSARMFEDYIGAAEREARINRVLVIAGDSTRPRGPYATARDLIESGVFQKHGVTHVDVAGHPEGNVGLSADALMNALIDKRDAAKRNGLSMGIVTQFSFDPKPIEQWLAAIAAAGLDAPVRIGLAGPANPATLLKFALRCGIGNSVAAVQKHVGTIGRLLRDTGPDGVVRGLGPVLASDIGARVENFHFFPFGGLAKTSAWIKSAMEAN
jgi:methylenetetrahydrofolate reductase (NADPH)